MSFNKFIGVGNLTKDPEMIDTSSSTPMTTFTVAINTTYKQNDEIKDEVIFLDSVVFGRQAEICKEHLQKGNRVLVEGRLRERSWEHEGQTHRRIGLIAGTVKFLDRKKSEEEDPADEEPDSNGSGRDGDSESDQ